MLESQTKMLTNFEVRNFKCFGEAGVQLELAPLTILVGPNGSGKSSFIDAIALLAQTAPAPNSISDFQWQGMWVDLGSNGDFAFHRRDAESWMKFRMTFSDGDLFGRWQEEKGHSPKLDSKVKSFGYAVEYARASYQSRHEVIFDGSVVAVNETRREAQDLTTARYQTTLYFPELKALANQQFSPGESSGSILHPGLFSGTPVRTVDSTTAAQVKNLSQEIGRIIEYMADSLRNRVYVVGPDRAPRKTEPRREKGPLRVGRSGRSTLPVLSILFASTEYTHHAERVRRWSNVFGLEKLVSGWVGGDVLQASYIDSRSDTNLTVDYAGFGSQQILPVITQLFCAPEGSLVMVEEPEISLHPKAQVDVVGMFAEAISMGQQIIATTHSQTLLLALPDAAKRFSLKPSDVAVYHFQLEEGEAKASRLDLDKNWYIKGWVPSFSDVESRLMKEWVSTVGDKLKAEN